MPSQGWNHLSLGKGLVKCLCIWRKYWRRRTFTWHEEEPLCFFVHERGGHFIIEKQLFSLRGARETLIIAGETNYLKEGGLLQDTGRYHKVFSLEGGGPKVNNFFERLWHQKETWDETSSQTSLQTNINPNLQQKLVHLALMWKFYEVVCDFIGLWGDIFLIFNRSYLVIH